MRTRSPAWSWDLALLCRLHAARARTSPSASPGQPLGPHQPTRRFRPPRDSDHAAPTSRHAGAPPTPEPAGLPDRQCRLTRSRGPQCGATLPAQPYDFGIIGITDGRATHPQPLLRRRVPLGEGRPLPALDLHEREPSQSEPAKPKPGWLRRFVRRIPIRAGQRPRRVRIRCFERGRRRSGLVARRTDRQRLVRRSHAERARGEGRGGLPAGARHPRWHLFDVVPVVVRGRRGAARYAGLGRQRPRPEPGGRLLPRRQGLRRRTHGADRLGGHVRDRPGLRAE